MRTSKNWLKLIRGKFNMKSSSTRDIIIYSNTTLGPPHEHLTTKEKEEEKHETSSVGGAIAITSLTLREEKVKRKEDAAAIKIQACFRGHLARRALRALKSLVKLQALVRGACARKQARIALHCMHALAKLHISVRGRQLLSTAHSDE